MASSPVSAGSVAERLAALPVLFQEWVDAGELSGAVGLVAKDGRILSWDAVGLADRETGRAMERTTRFWVASMTKPVTAAAILLLVEEGRLGLDDPVESVLPEFSHPWMVVEETADRMVLGRPKRGVTIRDLLTHTHGLQEPPMPAPRTPLAEAAAAVARGPLLFEPGSQWKYGNAGMTVLGRVVEVVSGMPYAEFLQRRFFGPLGMSATTFYPDGAARRHLAVSYGMRADGGGLEPVRNTILNGDIAEESQTVAPGAGLFSTAEDIFRFYQMLANGGQFGGRRYLSETSVREMIRPQTGDLAAGFSAGMAWGLGVGIVRDPQGWTDVLPAGTWGHDGAFGTTVMIEPRRKLLFILMIQRAGLNPFEDGLRFRHGFHTAVMKAMADAENETAAKSPSP